MQRKRAPKLVARVIGDAAGMVPSVAQKYSVTSPVWPDVPITAGSAVVLETVKPESKAPSPVLGSQE